MTCGRRIPCRRSGRFTRGAPVARLALPLPSGVPRSSPNSEVPPITPIYAPPMRRGFSEGGFFLRLSAVPLPPDAGPQRIDDRPQHRAPAEAALLRLVAEQLHRAPGADAAAGERPPQERPFAHAAAAEPRQQLVDAEDGERHGVDREHDPPDPR